MTSRIKDLYQRNIIHPPAFVADNLVYEVIMGSQAYGTNTPDSDEDIYGICIPDKHIIFPHLAGEIAGFGTPAQHFNEWQEHHVIDNSARGGKGLEHDFKVYSIVKIFDMLMKNNPNVIDMLFVPQQCILTCTSVGTMIRENRKMFLHKGAWSKFKGYAYEQLGRMSGKKGNGSVRVRDSNNIDRKFLYHLVRLVCEAEQLFTYGELDLLANREQLKAIRDGDAFKTLDEIYNWFAEAEIRVNGVHAKCTVLPEKPDEAKIKTLLIDCLEHHYGSFSSAEIVREGRYERAVRDIKSIVEKL